MSLKERIIRSKIARLDAGREAPIRRLESELARPVDPAPPGEPIREAPEAIRDPGPRQTLSDADIAGFQALKAEVQIRSEMHKDIWLVPRRTGAPRFEILPEEIRLLSLAGDAFDAKVVEVRRNVPARL